jgi:predicted phosphodiesterase
VFADLHYKKGMNAATVEDLDSILYRAFENHCDFVIHAGDFSNDYIGSPEIVNTYLKNKYQLPVYGVYGNHDLESENNTMEVVTRCLSNDSDVTWGTEDGCMKDGSIGYYYFDVNGYRIVCTDTNYSYNETKGKWEHNETASWGAPSENKFENSLGPEQLEWLETVLVDAAKKKISCIVVSHACFTDFGNPSPDTKAVQNIFAKVNRIHARTVIMCINGHYHTNHVEMKDNILHFDVNTVLNGSWRPKTEHHYSKEHTFLFEDYDRDGNLIDKRECALTELSQSVNTHYFAQPLSAIVKKSVAFSCGFSPFSDFHDI